MAVLLTHGYFLHDDPKEQVIMKPYPPLGILYLAAWLDENGMENTVFDTTFSTFEQLQQEILRRRPHVVALYTNLMTKLNVIRTMHWIRSLPELSETLIVLGGPDVTHNTLEYLQSGTHLIVIGEGEQTMLEIAQAGFYPEKWVDIAGLAYLLPDGSVFKTAARTKIRSLDDLPLPSREKIDLQLYLDAWKNAHGHSAVSVSTQRGCPYTCKWCSTAVYGQSYRRRPPAAVVDEIEWLQARYQFDLIWFVDDVFTVSHKWLEEFRDELHHRNVKVQFECITRADRLTDEVVQVLHDAGCFRVWIGAESGSQKVIDAMDRRVDVQQVRSMLKSAKKAGIQTGTFIMLGYPGETEADIRETIHHLQDADPDLFTITVAYPIKGTSLYNEVETGIHSNLAWDHRTDRDLDFKRTYPRKYYNYAVRWTVNAVHWDKSRRKNGAMALPTLKFLVKRWGARAGMIWSRW